MVRVKNAKKIIIGAIIEEVRLMKTSQRISSEKLQLRYRTFLESTKYGMK